MQIITTLLDGIIESLPQITDGALQLILTLPMILDAAFKIMEGLAIGIINSLPTLIESLPTIINSIVTFLVDNLPKIISMGGEVTLKLAAGLISSIPQLVAQLPQIITSIVLGLGSAGEEMMGIGENIVIGLWDGIASMITWLKKKVSDFVGGIVSNVKGVLGIQSPSKVFAGIGKNMGEGIGIGFEDAMKSVENDMENAIPTDFDLDLNSQVTTIGKGSDSNILDITIPLTIDGTILTRIIAQLQWNQNTVTIRNLWVAGR